MIARRSSRIVKNDVEKKKKKQEKEFNNKKKSNSKKKKSMTRSASLVNNNNSVKKNKSHVNVSVSVNNNENNNNFNNNFNNNNSNNINNKRVIVIGAGMSGLAAARELQHRRYNVLLVEARSRLGGRVWGAPIQTIGTTGSTMAPSVDMSMTTATTNHHHAVHNTVLYPNTGTTTRTTTTYTTTPFSEYHPNNNNNYNNNSISNASKNVVHVDLGGALIHGTVRNPLSQLCVQLGVATTENLEQSLLLDNTGWPVDPKQDEKISQCFNDALEKTFQEIQQRRNLPQQQPQQEVNQIQHTTTSEPDMNLQKIESQSLTETEQHHSHSHSHSHNHNHNHNQQRDHETNQVEDETFINHNFGHLFHKIAMEAYGSSIVDSPLWTWHQANLELSCGAPFDLLGYSWNDDEAYGYEGAHVSLRNSWKTVVDALAEPLDIVYNSPVAAIQITEDDVRPPLPKPSSPHPASPLLRQQLTDRNGLHEGTSHHTPSITLPSCRKSRRLQGEEASTPSDTMRRSTRTAKRTQPFTVTSHSILSYDNTSLQHPEKKRKGNKQTRTQQAPKVHVTLQNGTILEADAVVCTIPLGVLKSGSIQFIPPLPKAKEDAIADMGCGLLNKCILSFSHVFWQDTDFLGLAGEETPFLILNGHKITGKPILIFMFGGESAFDVDAGQDWHDSDLVEECMSVLRKICKTPHPPLPLDYVVTRWGQDVYAQMSFSYIPPNIKDGEEALNALGQPLLSSAGRPMVLFAGEHTTPFHPSTIHGAFLSGIREAYRLDLTLEPDLNNQLAFDSTNLYQKTFPLKRLKNNSAIPSQSVLDWANTSNNSNNSSTTRIKVNTRNGDDDPRHPRRRRRHGAMTLRKKKGPSSSVAHSAEALFLTSPTARQSVRNALNESEVVMEPSRKSQRKAKSPRRLTAADSDDDNDHMLHDGNDYMMMCMPTNRHPPKGSSSSNSSTVAGANAGTTEQEERTLQRLVHQYPNWQVIAEKVLPLYNSTRKSLVLKRRFQQLRRNLLKHDNANNNSNNKTKMKIEKSYETESSTCYRDWKVGEVLVSNNNLKNKTVQVTVPCDPRMDGEPVTTESPSIINNTPKSQRTRMVRLRD